MLEFSRGNKPCVIETQKLICFVLGRTEVDVRYLEHLVEPEQLELCGWILKQLKEYQANNVNVPNRDGIKQTLERMENRELESITPFNNGMLAPPRLQDVIAVLNRLR